jgi:CubicO group peptidase (beta-lactamase class C family)
MYVGIPDSVESRIATLEEDDPDPLPPDDGTPRDVPLSLGPLGGMMNRPDTRRACIPATTGIMTALAIARHYAALLPGGVDGVELLPPRRIRIATELQKPENPIPDAPAMFPMSLGYALGGNESIYGGVSAFGHSGYGGSFGFADPQSGLAVGFTKNRFVFHKEDVQRLVIDELRSTLPRTRRSPQS